MSCIVLPKPRVGGFRRTMLVRRDVVLPKPRVGGFGRTIHERRDAISMCCGFGGTILERG